MPSILAVDDSAAMRQMLAYTLRSAGHQVTEAVDGVDALEKLQGRNYDVVLTDQNMPRMDGFEFTKTIKADDRQSHIPIIMITSRTAEKHRNHAMELGVNEYLGKPYQDDQLLALVARYVGRPV